MASFSVKLRHAAPQSYSTCVNLSNETWTLLWAYERPPIVRDYTHAKSNHFTYCEGLHRRKVQPFQLLGGTTLAQSPTISPIVRDNTSAKSNHFTYCEGLHKRKVQPVHYLVIPVIRWQKTSWYLKKGSIALWDTANIGYYLTWEIFVALVGTAN